MVEPTETESLETLDAFVDVMREIAERAASDPDSIKRAPFTTLVGRLDEAPPRGGPTCDIGSVRGPMRLTRPRSRIRRRLPPV